jgi:hypothetical protein
MRWPAVPDVRRLRPALAVTAAAALLLGIAGCTPIDQSRILAEVKHSVETADPDLTGVEVDHGIDGFASVLWVGVGIQQGSIDVARLRRLLKAAVDTPGADGFTMLNFSVSTPDVAGDLVDLREAAGELHVQANDPTIDDDVSTIRKQVG